MVKLLALYLFNPNVSFCCYGIFLSAFVQLVIMLSLNLLEIVGTGWMLSGCPSKLCKKIKKINC